MKAPPGMTTVILYEDDEGKLFLRLQGEPVLWCMDEQAASTFLTDALVAANHDEACHPSIFSSHIEWRDQGTCDPEATINVNGRTLRAIAILQLDPQMGEAAAAYTLFCP